MEAGEPVMAKCQALFALAIGEYGRGRLDAAIASLDEIIALRPDLAEAHSNRGVMLRALGRFDEAVAAQRQAVALKPVYPEAHYNLANLLDQQGRLVEAVGAYRRAVEQRPDYSQALSNLGLTLDRLGRGEEAVAAHLRAIALAPAEAAGYNNLGNALVGLRRDGEAVAAYARAVDLAPDLAEALGHLLHLRQRRCDWAGFAEGEAHLLDLLRHHGARVPPFHLLGLASTAADQQLAARRVVERLRSPPLPPPPAKAAGERLRLGYLSADFRQHPVAAVLAEVIERHDRARFEVVAYSIGPDDGSAMRRRLEAGFDRFVDLRSCAHFEAAQRIRADGIDILIDLAGHTEHGRPEILAARPAPIQVNWLGYPGTSGAGFIDYLIADRMMMPAAEQPVVDERLVHLPDCYQPSDGARHAAPAPSRAACGLPADGFVFCSFNNSYKITPPIFSLWMRLLAALPGAVLWLSEANAEMAANLRREAATRGVEPSRLVFAPRLPMADYLARLGLADLFLDTLPYNAGATANDALWAGLPLLTCRGGTYVGRMAASLLTAAGLPELVAPSLAAYEAEALALAGDPARLALLRAKVAAARTSPLFDTPRFTRHLEAAYARMWSIHQAGAPPEALTIGADGR